MTDDLRASEASSAPRVICPFLLSEDGAWRSASAAREHRCTAVTPPAPLAAEKQRRLCLVGAHASCATYVAAIEARAPGHRPADRRRPITRPIPVLLDQSRVSLPVPGMSLPTVSLPRIASTAAGQGVLIGVLAIAFGAVLIARLATGGGGSPAANGVGATASPTPSVTTGAQATKTPKPTPSPTPIGTPKPTPTVEPSPTLVPTGPSPTPSASLATYKIKSGDTLSAIAARFGTTVKAIVKLNGIKDPAKIHVGQVIKLP